MDSWAVVSELGLVVKPTPTHGVVVYGSADPLPNPAELMLTQLVASRYKLDSWFFVYEHGKNLHMPSDVDSRSLPPQVFYLESIVPEITLGDMAREIYRLRQEPVVVAHTPSTTLRATSRPEEKWSGGWDCFTIRQLHKKEGWLGGSAIHYLLRLWAEKMEEVLYICPFQEKGRVYEIYKGVSRPLFILAPFVKFVPPARLKLPEWAPAPWGYWLSLPASFRRRVRKKVKRRILSGERRIEIPLP